MGNDVNAFMMFPPNGTKLVSLWISENIVLKFINLIEFPKEIIKNAIYKLFQWINGILEGYYKPQTFHP